MSNKYQQLYERVKAFLESDDFKRLPAYDSYQFRSLRCLYDDIGVYYNDFLPSIVVNTRYAEYSEAFDGLDRCLTVFDDICEMIRAICLDDVPVIKLLPAIKTFADIEREQEEIGESCIKPSGVEKQKGGRL